MKPSLTVTPQLVKQPRERLFTRDFGLVCASSFTVFSSFYLLLPTLPVYVKSLGGGEAAAGLVIGIFSMSAVIVRVLVGHALDVWGRKALFVGGGLGFLSVILLYSAANGVVAMTALQFLSGIGWAAVTTAAPTLAADMAPPARRGEGMGYYSAAGTVAMGVAPAAGLWLINETALPAGGFHLLFACSAGLAAVSVALAALVRETRLSASKQAHPKDAGTPAGIGVFLSPGAVPVSLALLCMAITYGAVSTFVPLYVPPSHSSTVGLYFAVYALAVLVSRPAAGSVSDRIGRWKVAIPAMPAAAAGSTILSLSPDLPVVLTGAVVYGLGFGAVTPTLLALAVDVVKPTERGAAIGTFMAACDTGIAIGAMALGVVSQMAGFTAMFLVAGAFSTLGLLYFTIYVRPKRASYQPSAISDQRTLDG